MPQPFYFFRFEFKRPVKLISPLVELERVRKLERWLGDGGEREGDAYFKLKDETIKTNSEPEIYRGTNKGQLRKF